MADWMQLTESYSDIGNPTHCAQRRISSVRYRVGRSTVTAVVAVTAEPNK